MCSGGVEQQLEREAVRRVVLYHDPASQDLAQSYTRWCRLQACDSAPRLTAGYALWLDYAGLALLGAGYLQPFRLTAKMLDARAQGRSLLAKACGVLPHKPSVLDPFAGFGLDAYVLARLGCPLSLVERQPMVWLMLRDFASQLGLEVSSACADGLVWLRDRTQTWDVVYLDPMFGPRKKRALPNRGLQHLQDLSDGLDIDLADCIAAAQECANQRVVLKRRRKDPITGNPTHRIKGHSIRFDIYM